MCFAILLTLTASACTSSSNSSDAKGSDEQVSEPAADSDAASITASEGVSTEGGGNYLTLADYEAAIDTYADSKVVLFFNATWCSTCKKARNNLEANLSAIPADITIVLVDFDSETDLKRQYGVTLQHTFVQIDSDGNQLAKWSGSVTAQQIAENTV
jgi:thiol-disulfide isomerase/thioredoxin